MVKDNSLTPTFGNALIISKTDTMYIWFLGATREIKDVDKLDNLIDNGG